MTVELIQGLLLAFALVVILMPPYIRLLQGIGFGKRIRQEGPESHFSKEGTPTMGGLLIVLVVLGISFFLRQPDAATFAPLAALALLRDGFSGLASARSASDLPRAALGRAAGAGEALALEAGFFAPFAVTALLDRSNLFCPTGYLFFFNRLG